MTDCIFCKIVAGDIPADKVYEDEHVLAFKDIAPKADTHILVIPKLHIVNLTEADDQHRALMTDVLYRLPYIAEQLELSGFRIIMNNGADAGQEVFHMHWHLLSGQRIPGF